MKNEACSQKKAIPLDRDSSGMAESKINLQAGRHQSKHFEAKAVRTSRYPRQATLADDGATQVS